MESIRAGVVTVSDKGYAGEREDSSGPLLSELLRRLGIEVVSQTIVPDERDEIEKLLRSLADETRVDLVVTTGGTGPAPRDVTPEATLAVIDREMPGLAEVLRFEGYRRTPMAVLSRGVSGIRGATLIVNLPGNPKAVREGMESLSPILRHAIKMLRGVDTEHGQELAHA
jgi:molybdenum cofactor synthesis domain-containing protein